MTFSYRTSGEPLSAYRLFQTRDVDEARSVVARSFCSHRLDCTRAAARFESVHNRAVGLGLSLNYLRYGAEVEIEPGELGRFYLIQFPLRGNARVVNGRHEIACDERRAAVLNPSLWSKLTWYAGCEKLIVQIDRDVLHRLAEALIGHRLDRPIVFWPEIDRDGAAVVKWMALLNACVAAAERGPIAWGSGNHHQAVIEEGLIARFLLCQPSVISHFFASGPRPAANTRQLRRAQSFIHDNLAEPITVAQIAQAAGCGIRSLQLAFHDRFKCSPMQYLHRERLNLAHCLLQTAPKDSLVSQIAYDVGFSHPGRFSIAYRQAYGCSPRETLSRS